MNPVFYLNDKKICNFIENLLINGYTNYNISTEIPKRIINILEENKYEKPNTIKEKIYEIPELKNKKSIFWKERKKYELNRVRYYKILKFIKKWLKGEKILDVGCGRGDMGFVILKKCGIKKYIGSDIYLPPKIMKCAGMQFLKQKTENEIPIKTSSINTITLIDMLHHVSKDNQEKLVKNIKSKLKENGVIIVFEYTFSEIKNPLLKNDATYEFMKLTKKQKIRCMALMDWISNILILNRKMPLPYSYKTMEEWEKLFVKVGFKVIISQFIGFPQEFFHQGPFGLLVLKR